MRRNYYKMTRSIWSRSWKILKRKKSLMSFYNKANCRLPWIKAKHNSWYILRHLKRLFLKYPFRIIKLMHKLYSLPRHLINPSLACLPWIRVDLMTILLIPVKLFAEIGTRSLSIMIRKYSQSLLIGGFAY